MPTRDLSNELAQQALDLVEQHGGEVQASRASGINRETLRHRHSVALRRGMTPTRLVRAFQQSETGHAVLVIPDSHSPFMHPDAIPFLTEAKVRLKPTRVVHLGDEVDNHALSQYDPDPDGDSAGVELHKAKEELQGLYALFSEVRLCHSNHGVRPFKKAYRAGIPRTWLKDYATVLESPVGWRWEERWEIDGVIYMHGEGFGGNTAHLKWAQINGKPTVIGHIHSHAGINYVRSEYGQIWGMNTGCLIDYKQYAFKYAKHTPHKPVIGVGFVDNGSPFFFPMRTNDSGRWTGKW